MPPKREQPSPSPSPANSGDELEDVKPNIKRARTKPAPKTKVKPVAKSKPAASTSGGKKLGAWNGDELRRLYAAMCPKRTGVNWAEVAAAVGGRDTKSCQNKWARMQSKINEAIAGMGE